MLPRFCAHTEENSNKHYYSIDHHGNFIMPCEHYEAPGQQLSLEDGFRTRVIQRRPSSYIWNFFLSSRRIWYAHEPCNRWDSSSSVNGTEAADDGHKTCDLATFFHSRVSRVLLAKLNGLNGGGRWKRNTILRSEVSFAGYRYNNLLFSLARI